MCHFVVPLIIIKNICESLHNSLVCLIFNIKFKWTKINFFYNGYIRVYRMYIIFISYPYNTYTHILGGNNILGEVHTDRKKIRGDGIPMWFTC